MCRESTTYWSPSTASTNEGYRSIHKSSWPSRQWVASLCDPTFSSWPLPSDTLQPLNFGFHSMPRAPLQGASSGTRFERAQSKSPQIGSWHSSIHSLLSTYYCIHRTIDAECRAYEGPPIVIWANRFAANDVQIMDGMNHGHPPVPVIVDSSLFIPSG